MNLSTVELKAFVPARDFELSKRFYQAIGFSMPWSDEGLAYLHAGACSFLLQNFYVAELASNFMLHLSVEKVDDWHRKLLEDDIAARFGVRIGALEDQPWAMRDFVLHDPSGVLWRISENLPKPA
jgi:hypothetical protein